MSGSLLATADAGADATSRDSLRIVMLGDLHTYRLAVWPWELLGKSLAGQANLWLNRRKRFDRTLLQPTIERAASLKPEFVLMSGDLTTTARPGEFADIAQALQPLLNVTPAMLVPGNHDVYTLTAKRRNRIRQTFADAVPAAFPFVRPLIGGWRLLVVDSAEPRLIDSRGRIGERQLHEVETNLCGLAPGEGVVVLCHYPFGKPPEMSPMKTGHRLLDGDRWRAVIGGCAARVVLIHGHVHCPWLWRVSGMSNVLDVNAGAPTMVRRAGTPADHFGGTRGQGFWEMTLNRDVASPITFAHHMLCADRGDAGASLPPVSGLPAAWAVGEPSGSDDSQDIRGRSNFWATRRIVVS